MNRRRSRSLVFILSLSILFAAACGDTPRQNPVEQPMASALTVVVREFAEMRVGERYVEPLAARGGKEPYTWKLGSDTLPDGMQLEGSAIIGVPAEAGRYGVVLKVEDAEGASAQGTFSIHVVAAEEENPNPPDPPKPPSMPQSRCDSPTFVEVRDQAEFAAKLPDVASSHPDTACGLSSGDAALFFVVPVAVESHLTVTVTSNEVVRAGVLLNVCPSHSAITTCGANVELDVESGNYLVLVAGAPGAMFTIHFTRETKVPPPPPGPPSCDAPSTLDLSTGSAVAAGTFSGLLNETTGSCSYGNEEAVYEIVLEDAADLRITPSSGNLGVWLRRADCEFGAEIACSTYSTLYLPNIAAGTYYLFVETLWSSTTMYSALIESLPPTPRPSNDTCTNAQQLSFSNNIASASANLTSAVPSYFANCNYGSKTVYYTFDLTVPSNLRVHLSSSNYGAEITQGSCSAPLSIICGDGYDDLCTDSLLQPGTYWIAVYERWSSTPSTVSFQLTRSDALPAPANDTCTGTQDITPGRSGRSITSGTLEGADDGFSSLSSCVYGSNYPDVFYTFDLSVRSDVGVTLTGANTYSMETYLLEGGCASTTSAQCFGPQTMYGLEPGTYGIVVETTDVPYSGRCPNAGSYNFQLELEVHASHAVPMNDTCVSSSTITLATVGTSVSIIGTTQGATDDVSELLCPSSYTQATVAPDVFYKIVTGEAGRIHVSTTSSSPVTISLHGTTCDATGALACASYYPGNVLETLAAFPPGEYFVRVDQDTSYSAFTPTDFVLTAELMP